MELSIDKLIANAMDRWLGGKVALLGHQLASQARLVYQLVTDEKVVAMMPFALSIE